jgi:anti-sigma regulatory factor (Ser/Thr protein kinase)
MTVPGGKPRSERKTRPRAGEKERVDIAFPSSADYLALVRRVARWFAERAGFPERDRARVELAVAEATTNIIRHAYGGDAGQTIRMGLQMIEGGIEVEFTDQGKGAPATALTGHGPGALEPGGLGLHMMKTCMDDLCYEPLPGGGARLTMRKLREGKER